MPDINFAAALASLRAAGNGQDPAFRIINGARVPTDYLWGTFLPERLVNSYDVKAGAMKIIPTMAGLAGADSPYAPGGIMDVSTFLASTAKIANTVPLTEMFMRNLHQLLQAAGRDVNGDEAAVNTVLNFINLLLVQAHMDRMESLRGELFTTGAIDWSFNGKQLAVSYGIPTANILTQRSGADYYGGSTSKFWTDFAAARALLKGQVRAVIAHPDTIDLIVSNAVNKMIVSADNFAGAVPVVKNLGTLATGPLIPSPDARERLTFTGYGKEGSILDPSTPGETIAVPFCSTGRVVVIGNPPPAGFGVDLGANEEGLEDQLPLGYTHIGPTVEGKGALGRWARVYTPDNEDWQLVGKAVTNGLPVLEAPSKVVILRTDMS